MRTLVSITLLVAALLLPDVASASRAPTKTEQRQIDAFYRLPARCSWVRISSVSARWASFRGAKRTSARCRRFASDGVTILHRSGGRWHHVVAGSDLVCPLPRIPRTVAVDLRPCWAWEPDAVRARKAALAVAQDEVERRRAEQGLVGTSTVELAYCDRNEYGWLLDCTLNATPDRQGVASVQCGSLEIEVTADARNEIHTEMVQANCIVVTL